MLKLDRSLETPELHFYHSDRSAFEEGFSYGCPRPGGLERQIRHLGGVCGPCWPTGYCKN